MRECKFVYVSKYVCVLLFNLFVVLKMCVYGCMCTVYGCVCVCVYNLLGNLCIDLNDFYLALHSCVYVDVFACVCKVFYHKLPIQVSIFIFPFSLYLPSPLHQDLGGNFIFELHHTLHSQSAQNSVF